MAVILVDTEDFKRMMFEYFRNVYAPEVNKNLGKLFIEYSKAEKMSMEMSNISGRKVAVSIGVLPLPYIHQTMVDDIIKACQDTKYQATLKEKIKQA